METTKSLGRRKEASARVTLKPASKDGAITVNGKSLVEYLPVPILQSLVKQPLMLLEIDGKYDINANVTGGGIKGQAEAIRLGIARAIVKINPELKTNLRAAGFMTRDPRAVERKKPGRRKARKRFQFSKR